MKSVEAQMKRIAGEFGLDVGPIMRIKYRNWKGVTEDRRILPIRVEYLSTEFHPKPYWALIAHCLERDAERAFRMSDIEKIYED